MAVTVKGYNHNAQRILAGLDSISDTFKVMLLNSSGIHNATHVTIDEVSSSGSYEVYGNAWPQGGISLQNVTSTIVNTNEAKFDADDSSQLILSGNLTFRNYVIYNSTDAGGPPLVFIERDTDATFLEDTYGELRWPSDGIINLIPL